MAHGRRGRGSTKQDLRGVGIPRLFTGVGPARCALTWWLKGEVPMRTETDEDGWGHSVTVPVGPGRPVPRPERQREDMEVIKVALLPLAKLDQTAWIFDQCELDRMQVAS